MTAAPPRIVAGSTRHFEADPIGFLLSRHAEHGDAFAVLLDDIPTVIFGGAAGPATLFKAERDHLAVHNTSSVHRLFRRAVFNLTGEAHLNARRVLSQTLTGSRLRDLIPALNALVDNHVARWAGLAPFDLHEATRRLTLDVCARVILGLPPGGSDDRAFPVVFEAFAAAANIQSETDTASAMVHRQGLDAAECLREMIVRRATTPFGLNVASLLTAADGMSLADVADHLLALLIAARETTATLLTWALIELAGDPESGNTVAEASGHSAPPTPRNLLREICRLHSPNTLSRRIVVKDLPTAFGLIPRGWHAAYSPAANHLLADQFEDPLRFWPGRFVGSAGARHAAGLLTFGRGDHACLGRQFAERIALRVLETVTCSFRPVLLNTRPEVHQYLPLKIPACPVWAALKCSEAL